MAAYRTTYRHDEYGTIEVEYPMMAAPYLRVLQDAGCSDVYEAIAHASNAYYDAIKVATNDETAGTVVLDAIDTMICDMGFERTSTASL